MLTLPHIHTSFTSNPNALNNWFYASASIVVAKVFPRCASKSASLAIKSFLIPLCISPLTLHSSFNLYTFNKANLIYYLSSLLPMLKNLLLSSALFNSCLISTAFAIYQPLRSTTG